VALRRAARRSIHAPFATDMTLEDRTA